LILRLLGHAAQVRATGGLRDRLGVVVVVLLSLHEGLHVDGLNDPRLVAKGAQGAADEVRAQAGLHADDAGWKSLERVGERQALDLAPEGDRAFRAEADEGEDVFTNVDPMAASAGAAEAALVTILLLLF
jgi:hypothetical protein